MLSRCEGDPPATGRTVRKARNGVSSTILGTSSNTCDKTGDEPRETRVVATEVGTPHHLTTGEHDAADVLAPGAPHRSAGVLRRPVVLALAAGLTLVGAGCGKAPTVRTSSQAVRSAPMSFRTAAAEHRPGPERGPAGSESDDAAGDSPAPRGTETGRSVDLARADVLPGSNGGGGAPIGADEGTPSGTNGTNEVGGGMSQGIEHAPAPGARGTGALPAAARDVPVPAAPALPTGATPGIPASSEPTTLVTVPTSPAAETATTTAAAVAPAPVALPGGAVDPASRYDSDAERRFLALVNDTRAAAGVATLGADAVLQAAARAWASQLVAAGALAHQPLDRFLDAWSAVGENVAYASSVPHAYDALLGSRGHYDNIVNPTFRAVGIGVVVDPDGCVWTVQVFAG